MKKPFVVVTTALSALALAGAVGVGVAAADPTSSPEPSPTTSASAASPAATPTTAATPSTANHPTRATNRAKHRDLTRRALHGEVTLGGTKHRVVDFQRGTVSAVSKDSLTVRSVDGFVGTYVVRSTTKVRVAKLEAAIGDVATGDRVRVVARKDGQTLTATRINDRQ